MEHIAHHIPKCQSSKTPSLFERVHIAHHMTFQNAQIPKCHRYLGLSRRPHHITFQNAQIPKCHRYLGLSRPHHITSQNAIRYRGGHVSWWCVPTVAMVP
eukprot:847143_1